MAYPARVPGMHEDTPPASRVELSTGVIDERHRLAYWADVVCSQLIRAEVHSVDPAWRGFHGTLERVHTAGMDVCRIRAAGQKVVRTPALLSSLDEPVVVITLQAEGEGRISQNGRTAVLHPGDAALFGNARPYELCFDGNFEQHVFILPQSLAQGTIGDVDAVAAITFQRNHPGNRLLGAYSTALCETSDLPETQAALIRDGMLQTLSAVLEGAGRIQRPGVRKLQRYHLARIHTFIRDHLADPELGVERIAAALRISPPYIHRLFEGEARTVSATIWQLRLEASRRDLGQLELRHIGVGEIGYRWGFADPAHFSRRFRQAFGMSPRAWRFLACSESSELQVQVRNGSRSVSSFK